VIGKAFVSGLTCEGLCQNRNIQGQETASNKKDLKTKVAALQLKN